MTEPIPFAFDSRAVRVVLVDDQPWWIAADVAPILGYGHTPHMLRALDDDEAGVHVVDTSGQRREMKIISESGLFAVILKSRKPEARRFRRWVTGEVLPALRRTGHYALPGLPAGPAADAHPETASDFDPPRLTAAIAVVREGRRLFGPQSARVMWMKLGLPAPLHDAAPGLALDPLAADLQAFCATVPACTIDEAASAAGIAPPDNATRLRLGGLLRQMGWHPRKVRRGRATVNLFAPETANSVEVVL